MNMHLMFASNHTSKAHLFKTEPTWSSLCWFYQVQFLEILPLLLFFFLSTSPLFLPPPWLLWSMAEQKREDEVAVRAQDPAGAEKG